MAINSQGKDRIYKIWKDNSTGKIYGKLLHQGNLNFDSFHPIECVPFYETSDIKKVYWTDGKNQPRLINIAKEDFSTYDDNSFDFIQDLSLREYISVTKNDSGDGVFSSGTIQYCFSYYNKYEQQSNIFYTSPILYTSYQDRGGSPEDKVSNSFNIIIDNADTRFQYIRIYSIFRSSIDAIPTCKRVMDVPITIGDNNKAKIIIVTDNGTSGDIIDSSELLYIGGEQILLGTFSQKDNTLFCGNITLLRPNVGDLDINGTSLQDSIQQGITFEYKKLFEESSNYDSYYPYKPESLNTKALWSNTYESYKTLKSNEWYRFGLQFQHKSGKWSEPVFIQDSKVNILPKIDHNIESGLTEIYGIKASYNLQDKNIIQTLVDNNYIRVRGVIVYPEIHDRSVICQGIVCPTVYNVGCRGSNSPFAMASYCARPTIIESIGEPGTDTNNMYRDEDALYGAPNEFRHNKPIPDNSKRNAEIQCITDTPISPYLNKFSNPITDSGKFQASYKENFFVDQSIITFHSPDIEFDDAIQNISGENLKFRIIGLANLTGFKSSIDVVTSTAAWDTDSPGFINRNIGVQNYSGFGCNELMSGPFWLDRSKKGNNFKLLYFLYPWHADRSLNDTDPGDAVSAMLKQKRISNLRYSGWNTYLTTPWSPSNGITNVGIFNSNEKTILRIDPPANSDLNDIVYQGNIDEILYTSINNDKKGFNFYHSNLASIGQYTIDPYSKEAFTYPPATSTRTWGVQPVRFKYKSTPHGVLAFNWTEDKRQITLPTINNYNNQSISSAQPFWSTTSHTIFQDSITIQDEGSIAEGVCFIAELYKDDSQTSNRFGGTTKESFENNQWIPCGEPNTLLDSTGSVKSSIPISWTEGDTYLQRYDCLKSYPFTQEDTNINVEIVSFLCETKINLDGRYDRNRGLLDNTSISNTNFNLINKIYSQKNNYFTYRGINYDNFTLNKFPNTITWTNTKLAGELIDTWANINMAAVTDVDGSLGQIRALKNFNSQIIGFQDSGLFTLQYNSRVQIPTSDNVPIEITNNYKMDGYRYISNKIGTRNKWSILNTPSGIYFIDDLSKSIYKFNGQLDNISDRLGFHSWVVSNINDVNAWTPYSYNNFTSHFDKIHNDVYFINRDYCLCYNELFDRFISFFSYEGTPFMFNIWDNFLSIRKRFDTPAEDQSFYIWDQNKGSFGSYFGSVRPYYTVIIANEYPTMDKTFNNIEFRADTWYRNTVGERLLLPSVTFDSLKVWNEYQRGEETLVDKQCVPSNLKQKFRVWRANIPRNNLFIDTSLRPKNPFKEYNQERIRNPWLNIKLQSSGNLNYETVLHDLNVYYTI